MVSLIMKFKPTLCIYVLALSPGRSLYTSIELLFLSLLISLHTVGDSSGCSTFTGLPDGTHRVRAISKHEVSGENSKKFKSDFFYFTTDSML